MTKPKAQPAKRGRKPKDPGEKLRQLTIRIPATLRLGLELVAREHGLSLSEATDRIFASAIESQQVAGSTVPDLITFLGGIDLSDNSPPLQRERVAEVILNSPTYMVMKLPASLRSSSEALFASVLTEIEQRSGVSLSLALDPPEARQLLDACVTAQRRGTSQNQLIDEWLPVFKAASSA